MNSKKLEEVRKRRAKAGPSRLNLYQKTVLLAGVLTLLFLAIGLSIQWAPFLTTGVAGGMLLLFLISRNLKTKKEGKNKDAPLGTFHEGEEPLEPEPTSSRAEGEIIADSPEELSKQANSNALQESITPEPEEAVTTPETHPVEKEDLSPAKEFSGDEVLAQIQERLAMVEETVTRLEDRISNLEEKAAIYQEGQLKSEPKIDLQTILSHLEEKEGKVI